MSGIKRLLFNIRKKVDEAEHIDNPEALYNIAVEIRFYAERLVEILADYLSDEEE